MVASELLLFILVMTHALSKLPVLATGYQKGPSSKHDGLMRPHDFSGLKKVYFNKYDVVKIVATVQLKY